MSLVAYGSSDEDSDVEDVQSSKDDVGNTPLNEETKETTKGKGLILPSPKQTSQLSNSSGRKTTLSSFLPKPKNVNNIEKERASEQAIPEDKTPAFSLESMPGDEEILEIEEEYEPILKRTKKVTTSGEDNKPKSVGSLFSLLPAPWQAENTWQKNKNSKTSATEDKRSKQPIKISIPTAPKNDSDEEDDIAETKKLVPSEGGSGLKALLPKPKHSITKKADNPNKPAVKLASRPLIPHTLTKKPTTQTLEKKSQKTGKTKPVEEATSDDEDEHVSFFTFNDKSESTADEEKVESFQSNIAGSSASPNVTAVQNSNLSVSLSSQGEMSSSTRTSHRSGKPLTVAPSPEIEEPSNQTAFASEEIPSRDESETRTYYYEQQSAPESQQYGSYSYQNYGNYSYDASSSSGDQPYYSQDTETYTYTYPTGAGTAPEAQAQGHHEEAAIDLDKLHKLQGKRNRREEINIIDVNAADQIGDSAAMVAKYGTEEIAYAPSRKKKDMPTSQQRRKHQITYLAFQAKERELELRQQWSANRQTRRQTQSKYGF